MNSKSLNFKTRGSHSLKVQTFGLSILVPYVGSKSFLRRHNSISQPLLISEVSVEKLGIVIKIRRPSNRFVVRPKEGWGLQKTSGEFV